MLITYRDLMSAPRSAPERRVRRHRIARKHAFVLVNYFQYL
jgi:hypothetical protein